MSTDGNLEPNPVHVLSQPGVVGQLFNGAHCSNHRASVPDVLGGHVVHIVHGDILGSEMYRVGQVIEYTG